MMLAGLDLMTLAVLALVGVALDAWLGEPSRWHPLVGFGTVANRVERYLNPNTHAEGAIELNENYDVRGVMLGGFALCVVVSIPVALAWVLTRELSPIALAIHALALYSALGGRALLDHLAPIARALEANDVQEARYLTSMIVSRDTKQANAEELARAAIESALENGNDAIFGALFWFLVAGAPGVVLFRLVNTLDAMWGYRNARFEAFGKAAARFDDLLNWFPARLTAFSYALLGQTRWAFDCWFRQAPAWSSPNAGPVMAAGAGSLFVRLGGPARYDGRIEFRPALGCGDMPEAHHVRAALALVARCEWLWLAVLGGLAIVTVWMPPFDISWDFLAEWFL
jgi:adenosylcobinamide-phosphate synthase